MNTKKIFAGLKKAAAYSTAGGGSASLIMTLLASLCGIPMVAIVVVPLTIAILLGVYGYVNKTSEFDSHERRVRERHRERQLEHHAMLSIDEKLGEINQGIHLVVKHHAKKSQELMKNSKPDAKNDVLFHENFVQAVPHKKVPHLALSHEDLTLFGANGEKQREEAANSSTFSSVPERIIMK